MTETFETTIVSYVQTTKKESGANEELRSRIAHHALERFIVEGYSRVRTEDLAAELGISKKTIYRVFDDKKELLREAVRVHLDRIERDLVEQFDQRSDSFPHRVAVLFGVVQRRIVPIQSVFIADLHRSAPEVWRRIEEFRRERVLSRMESAIRGGIAEGYLRSDIQPGLFVGLLSRFIQQVITPRTILDFDVSFAEVFRLVRVMFFEGTLSESGRKMWEDSNENPW